MKHLSQILFFFLCTYSTNILFAQTISSGHQCITPHWWSSIGGSQKKALSEQYPNLLMEGEDTTTLYVDVVFHVVWNSEKERIAETQIRQQLADLNKAFSEVRINDVREVFHPVIGIPNIQFRLATINPDGNQTSGINYKQTDVAQFLPIDLFDMDFLFLLIELIGDGEIDMDQLILLLNPFAGTDNIKKADKGGVAPWDTERYVNIWVGDVAIDGFLWQMLGMSGDILGYAKPPADAPYFSQIDTTGVFESLIDGVVLNYKVCGQNNPSTPETLIGKADEGKTLAHEIGHYLGLPHIWGVEGCDSDDLFEDTPNASVASTFDCDMAQNSCSDESPNFPDMIENYMDYSSDACKQMFTIEQVGMMRAMLKHSRSGLLQESSVTVGIEDALASSDASTLVYPNPSTGLVWLQYSNDFFLPPTTVQIYNLMGQQVLERAIEGKRERIDCSDLEKGIYLIQVSNGNDTDMQRIMLY